MITCTTCNARNEAGATFCDQCGSQLTSAPALSPPPVAGGDACPQCSSAIISGEMFCDNCGAQLESSSAASPFSNPPPAASPLPNTPPAAISPSSPVSPPAPSPPVIPPATPPTPPSSSVATTIQLVASNGEIFALSGKTTYVMGREDAVSGIYPDVDTTNSGGADGGVSRRHAQIIQQGNQWFVEDFNSTNGTQVNNQRLLGGSRQSLNPVTKSG